MKKHRVKGSNSVLHPENPGLTVDRPRVDVAPVHAPAVSELRLIRYT